ncbi:MAG: hypothetical protein KC621_25525, partial [Myxococcales bacterium]|nr:hypothetical protein [Myxococcales bacterium]
MASDTNDRGSETQNEITSGSAGPAPRSQEKGRERKPKGPPREVIVSTTGREIRVALLENGRLAELHVDRGDERGFVGNVYLGRVVRVLPGMQAAFVDIGLERAAFLYVGDIHPDVLKLEGKVDKGEVPTSDEEPRAKPRSGQPSIQDLVKEGQEVVVQVAKDPIGTKG